MTVLLPSTAETDLAKFALSLQQLAAGRSNATGTVTLATGAASTVVSAVNCAPTSAVFLFPKTADAALTVKKQIFTASGTYTPSAGMVYCIIEGVGSGGAGGGVTGGTTASFGGGGGGSGSYSRLVASAATIGVSQVVTIGNAGTGVSAANGGAGADCSLGSLLVAKGGGGGFNANGGQIGAGGLGGANTGTGDIVAIGAAGTGGGWNGNRNTVTIIGHAGTGGSSFFGGGAGNSALTGSQTAAGITAAGYGGGGGGAFTDATASNAAGGNGSKGVIFVTEHCSPAFVSSVGKQTFTISHDNNAIADRTYFYVCLG